MNSYEIPCGSRQSQTGLARCEDVWAQRLSREITALILVPVFVIDKYVARPENCKRQLRRGRTRKDAPVVSAPPAGAGFWVLTRTGRKTPPFSRAMRMKTILGIDNALIRRTVSILRRAELLIYDVPVFQAKTAVWTLQKSKRIILNDRLTHCYIEKLTDAENKRPDSVSMGHSEGSHAAY